MLVEDNELKPGDCLRAFVRIRSDRGCGREWTGAIKLLGIRPENYYELIFMDIQMPVMNEPEAVPPFEPQNHLFRVLQESTKWGRYSGDRNSWRLNDKITKSDVNELVLVQEALQEEKNCTDR